MRYLIAIISAVIVALIVTVFVSPPLANWVVSRFSFDSPDEVGSLHALVYMAINVTGLAAGWLVGWAIGGLVEKDDPVP